MDRLPIIILALAAIYNVADSVSKTLKIHFPNINVYSNGFFAYNIIVNSNFCCKITGGSTRPNSSPSLSS